MLEIPGGQITVHYLVLLQELHPTADLIFFYETGQKPEWTDSYLVAIFHEEFAGKLSRL